MTAGGTIGHGQLQTFGIESPPLSAPQSGFRHFDHPLRLAHGIPGRVGRIEVGVGKLAELGDFPIQGRSLLDAGGQTGLGEQQLGLDCRVRRTNSQLSGNFRLALARSIRP